MQHKNNYNKNRRQNNNGGNRNQNFDSNGPNGRIKGSAKQISDKYQSMARDSYASGDNTSMENFYQHAEHYFRINNYLNDQADQKRKFREKSQANKQEQKVEAVKEEPKATPQDASAESTVAEKKTKKRTTRKTKVGSNASTESKE